MPVAIFPGVSTPRGGHFPCRTKVLRAIRGQEGIGEMERLCSLPRPTPAHLGRRFVQSNAIAAASLPDAGI